MNSWTVTWLLPRKRTTRLLGTITQLWSDGCVNRSPPLDCPLRQWSAALTFVSHLMYGDRWTLHDRTRNKSGGQSAKTLTIGKDGKQFNWRKMGMANDSKRSILRSRWERN